jgi:hypothetical protein
MIHKVELERRETRTVQIDAASAREAAEIAEKENDGFDATAVDDAEVIGRCECCGCPILEGDKYEYDAEDGLHFCGECY